VDSLTESRDKNINKLKNIVYVVLALNIVLILLLIADFISYARRDRSNEGYETSYGFTTLLFSFIAKLYCYTVYLPSIYASLRIANYSNDPVGITNIVLTIIISKWLLSSRERGVYFGRFLLFENPLYQKEKSKGLNPLKQDHNRIAFSMIKLG